MKVQVLNLPRWYNIILAGDWRKELAAGLSDSELVRLRFEHAYGKTSRKRRFLINSKTARPLRTSVAGRQAVKRKERKDT